MLLVLNLIQKQFYGALSLELEGKQWGVGKVVFGSHAAKVGELQAHMGIVEYGSSW